MTSQDFIDKFLAHYHPIEYSKPEFDEIEALLYNLSSGQKDILYEHIREEYPSHYKKPPGYSFIYKACQKLRFAKSKKSEKLSDDVYKKTPQYALDRGRDMTSAAIVDHVKFIRKKQDQLWNAGKATTDLNTEDISFLSVWAEMPNIKHESIGIAKDRILAGNNVLYDLMEQPIKVTGIENKKVIKEFK